MLTLRTWLLVALACGNAAAQAPSLAFSYRASTSTSTATVTPNGTIAAPPTAVASTATVFLLVENRDTTAWTLAGATVNAPPFRVSGNPAGIVNPGDQRLITLLFEPISAGTFSSVLSLQFTAGSRTASLVFFLSGNALSPEYLTSYLLLPNGNQTALAEGASLLFEPTLVGQTASATVIVSNRGTGAGAVNRITLSGAAFRTSGIPLLPASILPDRDIRFTLTFAPNARERFAGSLRIEFANAPNRVIPIEATGIGADLVFESSDGENVTRVEPNGTVSMPDTNAGTTSQVVFRLRNAGDSDARITAFTSPGAPFSLADLPPLPATVAPGASLQFTIAFAPRESGVATARFRIDGFSFDLRGVGVGARLTITARPGSADSTVLASGASLAFPNTRVGMVASTPLSIRNTGNSATSLNTLAISGSAFRLQSRLTLPVRLEPDDAVEVVLEFVPDATTALAGSLQVEAVTIALRGIGDTPIPLSGIDLHSLPSTMQPLEQPAVGIRLDEPYPLAITGRLTLSFTSDSFVDDPMIQFSSGGRTADFQIPANSREAIFGLNATTVALQAGTVAGRISLTASFQVGSVSLTPAPAPVRTSTVPALEPQLRTVTVGARSDSSFELLISGFTTTRSLREISLRFAPVPGSNLQTTTLVAPVEPAFLAWFQGTTSRVFGSQFVASITVMVQGDSSAVQAVSVTATNSRGESAPVSVNLR